MEITIAFDILIALTSLWVLSRLIGYGGLIGDSLARVGYGIVIIGFSQLIETFGLLFFDNDVIDAHVVHRTVLTIGFIFVAWGFKNLMGKK